MKGVMTPTPPTDQVPARTLVLESGDHGAPAMRVYRTKLLVVSGPLQGKEFLINKDYFTIGSGEFNDLVVSDSTVSRRHCEILLDATGYTIRDLGSTNGTKVQNIRVASAELTPGTEIQLGKTRLVFCPMQESDDVPLSPHEHFGKCVGRSVSMRRLFHLAETYAPTDATIMITGETGTGKEVLAEEIHLHSLRAEHPFVVIDCAAISKDQIESELFGHVKGAYAGADTDRQGAFEIADGGTVFLDEIGELSPDLQPKLLRVLEKREIRRLGSNDVRKIDVRIICATNHNLPKEVNDGTFREDLYYRISGVQMELPPLRRRRDDIPLLVKQFITDIHGESAISELANFDQTMEVLKRHEWPGNVRELRNLVELAFYGERRPVDLTAFLSIGAFRRNSPLAQPPTTATVSFDAARPFKEAKNELIEEFERSYLNELLDRNRQNISRSAKDAGIERAYLQRLMSKYGLRK